MTHLCLIVGCTTDGVETLPKLVLCRHHRKVLYHKLCELHHEERAAKEKADEAHRVAHQSAGWTKPPEYMVQGRGDEMSGGLPSLGKGQ